MKLRYLIASLAFALVGCTTQSTPPLGSFEVVSVPETGEIHSAELGNTLLRKLERTSIPSIRILEDYLGSSNGLVRALVKEGLCIPKGSKPNGAKLFAPQEAYLVGGPLHGNRVEVNPLELMNGKLCWGTGPDCIPNSAWKQEAWIDYSRPYFEQELIYNGRVENNLRFIYREFAGDMARDAFTQEIQYDLDASPVIGFKGARIEVVSASNTNLTYKVIANFP